MTLYRNISGTWKEAVAYRNISGTWKQCVVWRNIAGVWKQISAALSVSVPASVGGVGPGPGVVTSDPATATASGGLPPYTTYLWTQDSGDAMTITSPNAATTTFSASVGVGATKTGVFHCTVTDSTGATDDSNSLTVTLEGT